MTPTNAIWLGVGFLVGSGLVFYQTDTPKKDTCETYRVSKKIATSYVLQPPAPEHIFCESPIAPKVVEAKSPEPETASEAIEIATEEKPRRRHRHMRRHRRYW